MSEVYNIVSENSATAHKKGTMDSMLNNKFAGLKAWALVKKSGNAAGTHYIVRQISIVLFFLIAVSASLCSCKNKNRRGEIEKIVAEWLGKEIRIPENLPCFVSGKETQPGSCDHWLQKEFKILMYVDSAGCSDCRLNLAAWKYLMEEADSLFGEQVGFLLYFQPKNAREMAYLLARDRFDYPVFMDLDGAINRLNSFPNDMQFQCFLLDKDNRVLMIGNPALNADIRELYKTQINNLINKKLTEVHNFFRIDKKDISVNLENYTPLRISVRGRANVEVALSNFVLYIPEMAGEIQRMARLDCSSAPLDATVTASTLNRRKTYMIVEMQEDGIT